MEGAVLAVVASRNKIPFIVLRTISDRADGNAACDFNTLLPIVGQNSVQLVEHLLKSLADSAQVSKNYVKVSNEIAESAKITIEMLVKFSF